MTEKKLNRLREKVWSAEGAVESAKGRLWSAWYEAIRYFVGEGNTVDVDNVYKARVKDRSLQFSWGKTYRDAERFDDDDMKYFYDKLVGGKDNED